MKIFVTLGTTPFDSFIKYLDDSVCFHDLDITIQSKGEYVPKNYSCFSFVSNIIEYYNGADIVITHAGAGSIYKLLELNKKIIVVPNFERVDNHQSDIAKYVEGNSFGLVCWSFSDLNKCIERYINDFPISPYKKKSFCKFNEISMFLDI